MTIRKYPRTPHLQGSRLQSGDEDLESIPFSHLEGRYLVVEEKLDGANAGISFDEEGRLQLQSRGHYLTGGPREKHFAPFKQWAGAHASALYDLLGRRYVLYGEWLYAKHTAFYDELPHYFLEFDVLDLEVEEFLSTERRRALLAGGPVLSVPVLQEGVVAKPQKLPALVRASLYKSAAWETSLEEACRERGLESDRVQRETDPSPLAEGLYIKLEEHGRVVERLKWVRASFLSRILDSESHPDPRLRVPLAQPAHHSQPTPRGRVDVRGNVMTIFDYTPQAPDFRLRWEDITQAYEWVRALEPCPQDPRHHAEGNVWIHTRLVCEALVALPAWRMLEPEARDIVFAAALLHDVAKPRTTRQETDGSITARGHSLRGAVDARVLLWRMGVPFPAREQICGLIRHHQVPFFLLERPDPKRLVIQMSQYLRLDWLALVAEADMRGRVCADQAKILDSVELFVEFCREEGSLDRPWPFASDRARFHYLQRGGRDPAYVPFDDTTCDVVLMSGFPGVGKDTWVSRNLAEWPVVSLDGLREELDVSPGEGQSAVVKEARERARVLLRRGESFVWNATNITRQIREACIALFADYRARVRIVYLETPEAILLKQNRDRTTSVPQQVIERLTQKWEVPDVTEADHVEWIVRPAT